MCDPQTPRSPGFRQRLVQHSLEDAYEDDGKEACKASPIDKLVTVHSLCTHLGQIHKMNDDIQAEQPLETVGIISQDDLPQIVRRMLEHRGHAPIEKPTLKSLFAKLSIHDLIVLFLFVFLAVMGTRLSATLGMKWRDMMMQLRKNGVLCVVPEMPLARWKNMMQPRKGKVTNKTTRLVEEMPTTQTLSSYEAGESIDALRGEIGKDEIANLPRYAMMLAHLLGVIECRPHSIDEDNMVARMRAERIDSIGFNFPDFGDGQQYHSTGDDYVFATLFKTGFNYSGGGRDVTLTPASLDIAWPPVAGGHYIRNQREVYIHLRRKMRDPTYASIAKLISETGSDIGFWHLTARSFRNGAVTFNAINLAIKSKPGGRDTNWANIIETCKDMFGWSAWSTGKLYLRFFTMVHFNNNGTCQREYIKHTWKYIVVKMDENRCWLDVAPETERFYKAGATYNASGPMHNARVPYSGELSVEALRHMRAARRELLTPNTIMYEEHAEEIFVREYTNLAHTATSLLSQVIVSNGAEPGASRPQVERWFRDPNYVLPLGVFAGGQGAALVNTGLLHVRQQMVEMLERRKNEAVTAFRKGWAAHLSTIQHDNTQTMNRSTRETTRLRGL